MLATSSRDRRIITIASWGHVFQQLDLRDLNFEKRCWYFYRAYVQSKIANILFTKKMAQLLQDVGMYTYTLNLDYDFFKFILYMCCFSVTNNYKVYINIKESDKTWVYEIMNA